MKTKLFKSVVVVSCFIFASFSAHSNNVADMMDHTESYLKVDFLPICNAEGQFKISFSNISPEVLLVENQYFKSDSFGKSDWGLSIYTADTGEDLNLKKPRNRVPDPKSYFRLEAGQSIEHTIDLRLWARSAVDTSKSYQVNIMKTIKFIRPNGQIWLAGIDTYLRPTPFIIEPSCFQ